MAKRSNIAEIALDTSEDDDYLPAVKRVKPDKQNSVSADQIVDVKLLKEPVNTLRYKDSLLFLQCQIMNTLNKYFDKSLETKNPNHSKFSFHFIDQVL